MNTKNNQRHKNSEIKMEQAFFKLLSASPPHKLSVKAICDEAGVNRTTFYAHYLDLYDMIDHIQAGKQREVVAMIDATLQPDLSNFIDVIANLFTFVKDNREFYEMYLTRHSGIMLVESAVLQKFAENQMPELIENVNARRYRMAFFISGLGAVMRRWLREGCQEPPAAMAQLIADEYRVTI